MIRYIDVKEKGFKFEMANDQVFEDTHGYPYQLVTKKLSKRIKIYWLQAELKCEITVCDKNHNVLKRIILNNMNELDLVLDIFGNNKN